MLDRVEEAVPTLIAAPASVHKTDIDALLSPVRPGLRLVEEQLRSVDSALFAPLAEAAVDLIGSGGKRLRPVLALMAAELSGSPLGTATYERVVALAAAVEMLHTATLVHDDVIDGALLRRGTPTLNATWNEGATVLAGNYLFGKAAYFAAQTQNMQVIELFTATLKAIVDGELRQLMARNDYEQDRESYYRRIYAKTASLFCAATEGAAILTDLPDSQIRLLRDYGYNLGMAFQIVDDILDFTGDTASLGKPAGSDLRQGTVTLPFFYFLQEQREPEVLIGELKAGHNGTYNGNSDGQRRTVDQIVEDLRASGAIEAARDEAQGFIDRARANLATLPDGASKTSMLGLCDFVIQRTY
jgi:geranylgeranyl pyrophosphate synthase